MLKDSFKFKQKRYDGTTYTAEKINNNNYKISWVDDYDGADNQDYDLKVIEDYIKNGDWIVIEEGIKTETTHKDRNFNDLTGRYFQVTFRRMVDYINKFSLRDSTLEYIEGYIENFVPMEAIVFNDIKYGFNIIPYQLIVKMTEVKDKV